jgi:predicted transcriptional regulator
MMEELNPKRSELDRYEGSSRAIPFGINDLPTEGNNWVYGGNDVKHEIEQLPTEDCGEDTKNSLLKIESRRRQDQMHKEQPVFPQPVFPQITREEKEDFLESARRFCKQDIMILAGMLEPHAEHGMTFGEIRTETGFENNLLNHTLGEMVKLGYIKTEGKQRSRTYYLTKYGQILYHAIVGAMDVIKDAAERSGITLQDENL